MNNNLCIITNIGAHYRYPIFSLISREIGCDFFLGDKVKQKLKTFDYERLDGYKRTLKNQFLGPFYWQTNSVSLVFKDYKYYLLDGEPFCLSSWIILILCKLMGKKTISWSHGWYGREGHFKGLIKRFFFSLFSELMLYNEYAIKLMTEQGFNPAHMYCIANSMDSDKEKELRTSLKPSTLYQEYFHNNYPTVIYCGRIQKWKKLDMIIDSMEILAREGNPINAIFIGQDIENVDLKSYAASKGLANNVWTYGPCYDDRIIGEFFYNASVCVSPGNVGLTAIHALSFGCPVITHNQFPYQNPEFEAIKPGITGDFFEKDNLLSMTKYIKKWTSQTQEERKQTRTAAFNEIDSKWNIHYQIKIIKEVISNKPKIRLTKG